MGNSLRASIVFGLAGVMFTWAMLEDWRVTSQKSHAARAAEPKLQAPNGKLDPKQMNFMRQKLESSGQILEGLTTEDSALIIKGAKALAEMTAAEKWKVRNDVMYRQFSGEFQRSAQSLLEAAEKENFDAAALKWIDTTMKCMECHKFLRGTRLAADKP